MNCLCPFKFHLRYRCLCEFILLVSSCVCVEALQQADAPSKEVYRLCIGLRNWKSGPRPNKWATTTTTTTTTNNNNNNNSHFHFSKFQHTDTVCSITVQWTLNYWFSGLCPLFRFQNIRKYVSETGTVSVLR
jgi:hypothetical protein